MRVMVPGYHSSPPPLVSGFDLGAHPAEGLQLRKQFAFGDHLGGLRLLLRNRLFKISLPEGVAPLVPFVLGNIPGRAARWVFAESGC